MPDTTIEMASFLGQLLSASRVESLLQEANELTAIMVASRKTASTDQ